MKQKEETTASVALADRRIMFVVLLLVVILFLSGMSLLGTLIFIAAVKEFENERF